MPDADLTVLILAGGAGRRMGGIDKGLLDWQGAPLIEHLIKRIHDWPGQRLISCNRNRDRYTDYAATVSDELAGFQGPLAGIASGFAASSSAQLLILPCDNPHPPLNCYSRLSSALQHSDAGIAYAHDGQRGQYLYALIDRRCQPSLQAYLASGTRSVYQWYEGEGAIAIDFSDSAENFSNINYKDDAPQ